MTITATFENGVLKPDEVLNLPDRAKVRITIEALKSDVQKEWDATREERLAALDEFLGMARVHLGEHLTRDQLHERR